MNRPTRLRRLFATAALTLGLTLSGIASPLSDLVESHKMGWMLGKWATADGNVSLGYEWKLDKHAIGATLKLGETEAEGLILLKPGSSEDVVYGSADNKGGVSEGKWSEQNGNPALKVKHTTAENETRRMVVEYVKVDDNTMKLVIGRLSEAGEAEGETREVTLTRQK